MSDLEEELAFAIRVTGLPAPERQYRAIPERRWKWDFAWPAQRLLLEVDGGGYVYGRHSRPGGMDGDAEKQSAAAAAGWRTMRATGALIRSGRARELLEVALSPRRGADVDRWGNQGPKGSGGRHDPGCHCNGCIGALSSPFPSEPIVWAV